MLSIKSKSLMLGVAKFFNFKICRSQYSSDLIENVLNSISDIIGVYNTEQSIILCNRAWCDFYEVKPEETIGKSCSQILDKKHECSDCAVNKAIESKKTVKIDKYVDKLEKYMEHCYNPVLDESGEVLFVVEQLKDTYDGKQLDEADREKGRNYRKIVNLSPDAIVISVDGIIVLANHQAMEFLGSPIGESIEKYILPDFLIQIKKGIGYILEKKADKSLIECKLIRKDKRIIDVEISSSYFSYKDRHAVLSLVRDISERNKEMNAAADYQLTALQKQFPIPAKAELKTIYVPAKTISGDFYSFYKVDEDLVIGMLGDVSGKGIPAALSISAFNVLFHEEVLISSDPSEILYYLNKKTAQHLGERYIATCCFSLDFKKNEAKVVGAGINQFIFHSRTGKYDMKVINGPFLGMFDDSVFGEQLIKFQKGDRFYFFTDGLDSILSRKEFDISLNNAAATTEVINYLDYAINDILTDTEGIKDDCTFLALEIK